MERENISKLRTLVQTKNTKLDQLKKKLVELSMASKARATLLNNEKNEKKKLLETIEHYKKNLAEREEVVAEKEKIIMELRSKTRTLENFRFVLDYRLQQLSAERGPITSHIEGLERHISTMYEELVEEFEKKKGDKIEKEKNEQRNALVLADLNHERLKNRKRNASLPPSSASLVTSFLPWFPVRSWKIQYACSIGSSLRATSLLTRRLKQASRPSTRPRIYSLTMTISRQRPPWAVLATKNSLVGMLNAAKGAAFQLEVEETLVETAKEAERQKLSKEKEATQLKHRLESTAREALVMGRKQRGENGNLLFEVNDMRKALRKSDHKIFERDEKIKQLEHRIREMELTAKLAKSGKSLAKFKAEHSASTQGKPSQLDRANTPVPAGSTPNTPAVVVPNVSAIAPTSESITDTLPNTEATVSAQPQTQTQRRRRRSRCWAF